MEEKLLIELFARKVKEGKITIEQVQESIREKVIEKLNEETASEVAE